MLKKALCVALCFSSLAIALSALAGGSFVPFMDGRYVGEVGAGGAAIAYDVSAAYFNPAGLTRIKHKQFVFAGNMIFVNMTFNGTVRVAGIPDTGTAKAPIDAFLPVVYISTPVTSKLVAAVAINSPFGQGSPWTQDTAFTNVRWVDEYGLVETVDAGPSFGYQVTNKLSVGAGGGLEMFTFKATAFDGTGRAQLNAYNNGFFWHAGMLYAFTPHLRFGMNYRGKLIHHATGHVSNSSLIGGRSPLSLDYPLPAILTASVFADVNQRWSVMGTVAYSWWSIFKEFKPNGSIPPGGLPLPTVPQNYRNTWTASIGAIYRITNTLALRAGVGFDEAATNDKDRAITLPSRDAVSIGLGAHWSMTPQTGMDFGVLHAFMPKAKIDHTVGPVQTKGEGQIHSTIVGFQLTINFGKRYRSANNPYRIGHTV